MKIFLPGGAGLVGLNLIARIRRQHPDWQLVVVDKKSEAIQIARRLFPEIKFINEDLCMKVGQQWPAAIAGCQACVMLQAEIGNSDESQFHRNNVQSTEIVLEVLEKVGVPRLIHVSSSVVNSIATDEYTITKKIQERIVLNKRPDAIVLRPTLMFGWFDRKHLGWLASFMHKFPIFPIPGSGHFTRQPLYVGDFCALIDKCLMEPKLRGTYDITGLEKISYVNLMRLLRKATQAETWIIRLPIPIFKFLLQLWAVISPQPVFTSSQLEALTAGDEFDLINWPEIFDVNPTTLTEALLITYQDPHYSKVEMPF